MTSHSRVSRGNTLSPTERSARRSSASGERLAAYALAFASGAAAMYGVQLAFPPAAPSPAVAVAAQPAVSHDTSVGEEARPAAPAPASDRGQPAAIPPAIATETGESGALVLEGITEPAPGHFAKLPLATSQAVAFIDVRPGQRIGKGIQAFSHWESPARLEAAKIEVERAKKAREAADARRTAALQLRDRVQRLKQNATAQEREDAETAVTVREKEAEAARLAVNEAERRYADMDFEFKQAFVTSPIDGIVAEVDVVVGERRQVGGPFRGVTVLDPKVLYCRALMAPDEAAGLARLGEEAPARITLAGGASKRVWKGKVASTGAFADPKTGRVPVLLEIDNPDESLRVGVRVLVAFEPDAAPHAAEHSP